MPDRPPLVLLAAVLLAACGGSSPAVRVTPGSVRCPKLPSSLGKGLSARTVTPAAPSSAAWGDPAVTLRCGVPRGNPLDEPVELDGVQWVVHDDGATHRWTTLKRPVPVEVVIPDRYDGQAELVIALSPALSGP